MKVWVEISQYIPGTFAWKVRKLFKENDEKKLSNMERDYIKYANNYQWEIFMVLQGKFLKKYEKTMRKARKKLSENFPEYTKQFPQ